MGIKPRKTTGNTVKRAQAPRQGEEYLQRLLDLSSDWYREQDEHYRFTRRFAVLFLDLDRFKTINDTLGHEAGDALLQEMAGRLKETLRSSDVVARMGGDEFVVLLQEVTEPEQVAGVARKLLSTVIRPVDILGQECRVTAGIGISPYPTDAHDEQALMKNAGMAMYLPESMWANPWFQGCLFIPVPRQ